jgi:prepilin-type N-terminal cleavage/methylation domain-containing protein
MDNDTTMNIEGHKQDRSRMGGHFNFFTHGLALILTFSPREKEHSLHVFGLEGAALANPVTTKNPKSSEPFSLLEERGSRAFTLIEMLMVITIMGIVAALVVTMGQAAAQKKKIVAVQGMKERLITMIENYHNKLNYYPPDNTNLLNYQANSPNYDSYATSNSLMYELLGGSNLNAGANLALFNNTNASASAYSSVFSRAGVANGDALEPHDFFQPGPAPKDYAPIFTNNGNVFYALIVPADLVPGHTNNFWHYDASSTNRHNLNTYDLWAEFYIGTKSGHLTIITNGNW